LCRYPFGKNSLFPNISLSDILELEFQLGYSMGIKPNFNDMEFFEFIWMYERMGEQRKKENEQQQKSQSGGKSITDLFSRGNNSG
jgi:hypothetical protein